MKTHFALRTRGNESNPDDEWETTACGLEETESDLSDDWEYVDCKRCHKNRARFEKEMEIAMEVSCKQMGEFAQFCER